MASVAGADGNTAYLLRHGQTDWSASEQHTGRTDVPLNAEGERQAREAGRLLRGLRGSARPVMVLSSQRSRALRTAELAGLTVDEVTEDLAEWDYGEYEGITTAEIRETVPDWTVWRYGARGGESVADVGARVDRVIAELRGASDDAAIFAHGHVIRVLAARWLGLEPAAGRLFALDTATLSILGYERETPVIRRWNEPLEDVAG
jgi:broad specificity phosphatase PhoE